MSASHLKYPHLPLARAAEERPVTRKAVIGEHTATPRVEALVSWAARSPDGCGRIRRPCSRDADDAPAEDRSAAQVRYRGPGIGQSGRDAITPPKPCRVCDRRCGSPSTNPGR
jgi:hypothetical protein